MFGDEDNLDSEVMKECRGLILDEAKDWQPVCVPTQRLDELMYQDNIDWTEDISVTEKVDGVPVSLFYYEGEWHISTRCTLRFLTLPYLFIC